MAGQGRPTGALAREQQTLKQAVLDAFGRLGGATWLVEQAEKDPALFIGLIGRLLPRQVESNVSLDGRLEVVWSGELPKDPPAPLVENQVAEQSAAPAPSIDSAPTPISEPSDVPGVDPL